MNSKEHIKIDESKLTIINKKWQIKAKPSKELIQEIIAIFSMPTLPSSSITTIDQILIRSIFSTKSDDDVLTVAAILLNFQSCLHIEVNEQTQLGEVLRKMISFGFFSSQIYELEYFSNELHSLILFVSNHLKKSNLNINQCSMATAFLLSCISPYVSKISLFNNLNGLQDILDIYLTKKVINDYVIPYFFDFFLAVFMSLTLDKKLESNEFNIFSNLMKILASTVMTQFSFNFDYISLTKKLLEYLSNHFLLITTRDELFNLILSLASKYEEASSILVEPSNSSKISNFISDYLKLIDFEYPLQKSSNPINLDTKVTNSFILSSQTEFLQPFKIKDDNSQYVTIDNFQYEERIDAINVSKFPEPGELEPIKKVEKISMTIQSLIQRISNLCRSISPQIQQNHIQFMSSFLRSEGARIPIGAFFIDLWAKNISFISAKTVSESFHACKFFQTALELSFFDYDDYHMKNFISSFIVWIASFSPETYSYIVDLINVFQNAIISVKLCPEICDLVVKCSIINPGSFVLAMKCSNFDILMSDDLYFYLYNCNNIETTGRTQEESKRLIENYQLLMRFLVDLSHEQTTFSYLYTKNDFLISILSQFFCQSTAEFAYEIILKILNSIPKSSKGDDVISPTLRTIFKFFATKLFKTQRMPASVLNFVIKFCTLGFDKLENQFSLIFKESHFFDIVVNVAIEQNLQNSIQALLNLFVQVTTSKNCITPNIELFLKLGPMIRSRDDVSVVDFLLKIVFNDDLKMTKSRKIVNPGPLSLLFQIFQDDKEKFKDYLKFVRECFELSKNEAVQTDFTTQLILYLREYRNKTEKDQEFDLVLDFLKDIMSISITQKDLLLFFQLFTSTKNNIRPFFTGDLLKTLNLAIKNTQAKSRSFFSLDSKSEIVLPPIPSEIMNSDFSIIMKIELRDRIGSIFEFKNPTTDDVIQFSFNEDRFLKVNDKSYETTLVTGKLILLTFSSVKSEYFIYVNKKLLIYVPPNQELKKKGSWKNGLTKNVVGEGLDANIEFIKIVYTNKNNKVETLYEFKAASFYEGCAIYKDEAIKVNCPIFHLPPSILDVLVSIGGVQVILPIFNQIEQPTNATNPDPNENLLELALTLLSTILNKSREIMDNNQLQIDFYSMDGFQLVSELLTLTSINKFNQPVFDRIFHLFSVITEPDLQNQMIEYVLFDLGTWVYIPDIAPLFFDHCFELLLSKIQENRVIANYTSLKIKNLLYLIRCHLFASTNKNDSICLSLTEKKTFTGDTFAERQTVKKLRDSFMSFISELCLYSCNLEDIHALCFFCLDDQDEIFQRSSLNLLKTIISKKMTKLNNLIIPKLPYKSLIELLNNNKNRKTSSHILLLLNEVVAAKTLTSQYKKMIIAKTMKEYTIFPVAVSYVRQLFQKTSGDFRIAITLNLLSLLLESNQKAPNVNARNPNKTAHQTQSQQNINTHQNEQTSNAQQDEQTLNEQQNESNENIANDAVQGESEANATQQSESNNNVQNESNDAVQSELEANVTQQVEPEANATQQVEPEANVTQQGETEANVTQQGESNTNNVQNEDQNATSTATSTNSINTENLIFMSDEDVLKQIVHIYRDLIMSITVEEFTENEVFFILFLLHTFLDKNKYDTIFISLVNITLAMWAKKANDPFGFLHKFVETIEFRVKNDYSDFLRRIYTASLTFDFPKTSSESLTSIICRFLFEIPSFDSYFFLFRFPQPLKPISFHDLFALANNDGSPFTTTYHYSLRVNDNCKWLDIDLASAFCEKYLMNHPGLLFNSQPPKTILLEQLAYIVGNGIINKAFLSRAEKLVNLIRTIKNPKSDNDSSMISKSRKNAIIILFGCISRQILRSNYNYKNDETTPDQLMIIFKSALEMLHNEVSLILKEKVDLSTDINFYLSSFSTLITKVESDYENRLLSNNTNNSIDLMSVSSGQNIFDSDETITLGTYTTANDPFITFADVSLLEGKKNNTVINVEQYRASLSNYATAYRKMKIHSLKQYKQLFSQLSSENGPWMTPEMPPEIHYKLFNTVTRSLLVPNLKFNDHKEASLARDLGSYENAQAILKEQIAKMKMETFSTDFSLIDFKDEDEETTITNNNNNNKQSNEKDLMICQSQLVTPRKLHSGDLNLTIKTIIFNSKNKYVKIRLNKIKKIMLRRYLMVDTAIEIFTTYNKVYFINFMNAQERLKFLNKVSSLKIPTIKFIQKKWEDTKVLLKKLVKKWQDGLLSNFDYLMKINILAGRSFNDLSQYPVFPWVIKDYTSEKLDLKNPDTYRCFSKPIGAIGQQRLALMREKMDQGVGDETKFLYGALYSSPAVVIGYLIRMEPFTSLHVQLQSNRFDVADRLFISIPNAYESVTTSQMDFRELIPEFFINPDFLKNENNFDLGVSVTSGNRINDVILPPWCNSAREFIEINKSVLESNFVTMNIHQWIDLIFGPHSRAPLSFEVDNVFSPAFYETSLEGADEGQITYLKECAACFGCACLQIFDDYPEALSININRKSFIGVPKNFVKIADFQGNKIVAINSEKNDILAVSSELHFLLNESKGKLSCSIPPSFVEKAQPFIAVNAKRKVAVALKWSNEVNVYHIKNGNNLILEPSPFDSIPSSFTSSNNVVTAISISNRFLAVAYSDYTLRVYKLSKGQQASSSLSSPIFTSSLNSPSQNQGQSQSPQPSQPSQSQQQQQQQQVSSLSTASQGSSSESFSAEFGELMGLATKRQVGILSKHTHSILFTCVCERLGTVYSISSDGFLSSMSLFQHGRYLRGVETGFYEPSLFIVSKQGFIVIAFNGPDSANIIVYDQNLEKIASSFHEAAVAAWTVAERCGEEILIVASKSESGGEIERMKLPFLESLKSFNVPQQVTAISFIKKPTPRLAFGFSSGTIAYANIE